MSNPPQPTVSIFGIREDEGEGPVLLTPWSVVHFLSGMAMKSLGLSSGEAFTVHAVYEVFDMYKREVGIEYNSSLNSVADQAIAMLGHYTAPRGDHSLPYFALFGGALLLATTTEGS